MLYLVIALVAIAWYAAGVMGFIHWWTSEFDLTSKEVPLAVFIGFIGPLAYVAGYFIHGGSSARVLKDRRSA